MVSASSFLSTAIEVGVDTASRDETGKLIAPILWNNKNRHGLCCVGTNSSEDDHYIFKCKKKIKLQLATTRIKM